MQSTAKTLSKQSQKDYKKNEKQERCSEKAGNRSVFLRYYHKQIGNYLLFTSKLFTKKYKFDIVNESIYIFYRFTILGADAQSLISFHCRIKTGRGDRADSGV